MEADNDAAVSRPEFSPFFFKLKAPYRAIAGFGYFPRYSELPEWLAWDYFGPANGSGSFEEMHARLEKIRAKIKAAPQPGILQIGCIVVVNATFLSREEWIPQPRDWAESNLRHTVYDLNVGEGARVWSECLARVHLMRGFKSRGVATKSAEPPRLRFSGADSSKSRTRSVSGIGNGSVRSGVYR